MKRLALALILAAGAAHGANVGDLIVTDPHGIREVRIVKNDEGGIIERRAKQYLAYRGDFALFGRCTSACAMRLWDPVEKRVRACTVPGKATFHLHGTYDPLLGIPMPAAHKVVRAFLPPSMRAWWQRRAATKSNWGFVTVSAAEMIRVGWARECTPAELARAK